MTTYRAPKVYVASNVASNRNIQSQGVWIDATLEPEEMEEAIDEMLREADEYPSGWSVYNTDDFLPFEVRENDSLEIINVVAGGIVEADNEEAFAAWAMLCREDLGLNNTWLEYLDKFKDCYRGNYLVLADYGEEIFGEYYPDLVGAIEDSRVSEFVTIDYEGWVEILDGIVTAECHDGSVFVFEVTW